RQHGQIFKVFGRYGAAATFDRTRCALLGFVERLLVTPAVRCQQIRHLVVIHAGDGRGERLDRFRWHIAALAAADAVFTGDDVGVRIAGVGHWDAPVTAVAEADLAGRAIECIVMVHGRRPEEIIYAHPDCIAI